MTFRARSAIGQVITSQATGNVIADCRRKHLRGQLRAAWSRGARSTLTASFGSVGSLGTGGTAERSRPAMPSDHRRRRHRERRQPQGDVRRAMSSSVSPPAICASTRSTRRTGNIRVEVPGGSLVDANNISVPDTQNLSELEARWNSMLATAIHGPDQHRSTPSRAYENRDRPGVSDLLDVPRRAARSRACSTPLSR